MSFTSVASYLRCSHCRGFYETARSACKYCGKSVPMRDDHGKEKIYRDRATCRAIQIAEFEQLPPEAHEDPMRPDPEELSELCSCLHCGQEGELFEAVEMRWMANEHMWACPCTTCGGRGFHFDIHPINPKWECNNCQHKWLPPDGNLKPSNCKCPKCGCTEASGAFDDEYSEAELDAMTDAEFEEKMGFPRDPPEDLDKPQAAGDEELPWMGEGKGEDLFEEADDDLPPIAGMEYFARHEEGMQDDIDFPREPPGPEEKGEGEDDDNPY